VHLLTESRLSSSTQQKAASPYSDRCAERRSTKRIRTALSPAIKPTGYQNSRMRQFNREFGYKTCKHRFEEKRKCNKLGRGDQAGSDISNVSNFNKYVKKANVRFRGGVQQKTVRETYLSTGSRPTSPNQQTTPLLSPRANRHVEKQPIKRKRKSLSKTGNGNQGAATKLQHSPVNTKDFREQSQDSSGDKARRSINTGSLTGAQTSCEYAEMKEESEMIQDCETY